MRDGDRDAEAGGAGAVDLLVPDLSAVDRRGRRAGWMGGCNAAEARQLLTFLDGLRRICGRLRRFLGA